MLFDARGLDVEDGREGTVHLTVAYVEGGMVAVNLWCMRSEAL